MKSYFLPLGTGANRGLPAILTAFCGGAARQPEAVSMLRVAASRPEDLTDRMIPDLDFCRRAFAGKETFAFFRTEWRSSPWIPRLPEREEMTEGENSRLLMQALRGEGVPFAFRTDREAAEWSASALLERCGEGAEEDLAPFQAFLGEIRGDLDGGEEVRIMVMCDLCEGYAAGLGAALLRFLRARFGTERLFLGLIAQVRAEGAGAEEGVREARDALASMRERNLIRADGDRESEGADACWLLGLPASLKSGEDSQRLMDWAAARILGEVWTGEKAPAAGLHTREIQGILTLETLDREAKPAAAFLRGCFWCLSDLLPALRSWFEHPALIRSLAPATRGGLFRRLFRETQEGRTPEEVRTAERTLRALALEILSLIRTLPPLLREAEASDRLWEEAVRACGRTVTLAAETDVRRKEAEDAGVDKVQPVHRESLKDTEEEEAIHQLDRMADELRNLTAQRGEVFARGGGFLAQAALEDCLNKCETAEKNAAEKLRTLPSDTPEERYALGMQERRTRLLRAAVLRCRQDLEENRKWSLRSRAGSMRPSAPFSGEILDPDLAEQAFRMLTAEGGAAAEAGKAVRDGIGGLLRGYTLNDAKTLLKNLLSACRPTEGEAPLRSLMAAVFAVCGVEVSGLRIHGAGALPQLPLLPDLREPGSFFSLASAPERMLVTERVDQTARDRGLLAVMILRQYRRRGPGEAALEMVPLRPEDGSLIRIYLSSRGVKEAWLCGLRRDGEDRTERQPLAVILPGRGIEAARLRPEGLDLVPSFAFWTDREKLTFRDPCAYFGEADRQILTEQLTRLRSFLKTPRSRGLSEFLSAWYQDITRTPRQARNPERLRSRLRIACGLSRLPIWQKELQRLTFFYESGLGEDPLCGALCGARGFEAAECRTREEVLYVFRDTPVARENARTLLESSSAPGEETYLGSLDTECDILLHSSDDYHEALAAGLEDLMKRFPAAEPEALREAESLLEEAGSPIQDPITELSWPWDRMSASVLTILTECLGKELAPAALNAFSGKLAVFPARGGEILGDAVMSGMCRVIRNPDSAGEAAETGPAAGAPEGAEPGEAGEEVRTDAVLPPLSPDFARALCRSAQGQSLVQPGFLRFESAGAEIRAVMTLEGAFTLKLIRTYGPEEILAFYAHDLPTLALWPSLPFAPEDWKAYCSYAHSPADFRFSAVTRTEEIPLTGNGLRLAARHREFPLCYLVSAGETELGAVLNLLPAPEIPEGGRWTACLDFGTSAASVVFTDGAGRWPMQGPVTVRTLMRSPAATEDLLWREFLPAVPVSAVIPAALRIFRRDLTEGDLPLRDGCVFMSASFRDVTEVSPDTLYTDLKWSGDRGRAPGLYLHQIMLMAALQARCGGARELNWRAAVPEEMAREGRERLAEMIRTAAAEVSAESGLPLPEKQPPAAFASESTALGAYFRLVCPEETRGGFMTLDLGADTADLCLYLQGREDAVRACQLPLGLHNLLLPPLLRRPGLLMEDFGFIQEPGFRQDLEVLRGLMEQAGRDPAALRQARYAMDAFLADHGPLLADALARRRAAGSPGRTGALILLNDCFLMMLAGLTLLQTAGDSLRNDTLPETMTLFLAGRGSLLIEGMSLETKTSLWRILTMFRNPRVSSLNLLFSGEKKMEIAAGLSVLPRAGAALPRPAASPAAAAVRPEELMPEFLLRFRREFPAEAELLFPGLYSPDFSMPFTPAGQNAVYQALRETAGQREAGQPYQALTACLNLILDMTQEGGIP